MWETEGEERRVARRWAPREPVAPVRSWDVVSDVGMEKRFSCLLDLQWWLQEL